MHDDNYCKEKLNMIYLYLSSQWGRPVSTGGRTPENAGGRRPPYGAKAITVNTELAAA